MESSTVPSLGCIGDMAELTKTIRVEQCRNALLSLAKKSPGLLMQGVLKQQGTFPDSE